MSENGDIGTMLAEQLERLFVKEVDRELRLGVEASGTIPQALWAEVQGIGAHLATATEEAGGAGLDWTSAEPILRSIGQFAAPVPLAETMLAAALMTEAGMALPEGSLAIATDVFVMDAHDKVSGTAALVPWLGAVDQVLLLAQRDGQRHLCVMDAKQLKSSPLATYARIPSAALHIDAVLPTASVVTPSLSDVSLLAGMAMLRTVQIAGALDHVLGLCIEYANNRVQFGKPIGKFQAIQHQLAELAGHVAVAQVAATYACRCMDAGHGVHGAEVAKSRVALSATRGAAIAHQVFGAIGVTDEHELHHYTRRLWQWRAEGGSERFWSERLGRRVLAAGGAALWPSLTDISQTQRQVLSSVN